MLKIDLHVHSKNSADGTGTIEENAISAKKRGIGAIAICDHDFLSGGRRKVNGILILYGQEISTKEGHVLVLGVKKRYAKGIGARELVKKVRKAGGVTIAAHPFALRPDCLGNLSLEIGFDAIERFNGKAFGNNIQNIMHKRKGVGGSDAHSAQEVGDAYTKMPCEANEKEILECIKEGKFAAIWSTKLRNIPLRYCAKARKLLRV
ncbi:hypothetical protein COV61_03285 [Candidatus Micrarchaeota archaeon CG11_big_fil_rev_8_21_14_0_20_47_5]|nr:MAG: hypothetical protein AUJ17_05145 [Candidatus Micrarchaeota archaeon CG1_02_47_40]PIN83361.1 MAG: hypothetical protein COV61_03285 [Candidatus Micrarchaeota archaeon CG11_big_fil_rev_8_21_14_0_20_47_5]